MAISVRTEAGLDFDAKRSTAVMSTGAAVLVVPETNGTTRRLYVYYSTDRVNWTLKNTLTPVAALVASTIYTVAIDAADNLHIAWKDSAANIKYQLLTYSAPGGVVTWTPGAEETVGAPGGKVYRYIDMDVVTGTVAFVGVVNYTDGTMRSWVRRSSDNTWVQLTDQNIVSTFGAASLPLVGGFTCARDAGGPSGVTATVAYIARTRDASGEQLRIKKFATDTGAQVSDVSISVAFATNGNMYRDYYLFSRGANDWIGTLLMGYTTSVVYSTRFSATSFTGWTRGPALTITRSGSNSSATAGCVGDAGNIIYKGGNDWMNIPFVINTATTPNSIRWGVAGYWQETDGVGGAKIFSGNNRNFSARKIDTFDYRAAAQPAKSWYNQTPIAPTLVDPGLGVTVTTDVPTVTTKLKNATARPQSRMRGKWLLARDAGFTTNLITLNDPVTEFSVVGTTQVLTAEKVTPELFQGTWYARAIQVNEFGVESSASGTQTDHSFVVSHPPVIVPSSPGGDAYYPYGATGAITFQWAFTDPSPTDYQTAKQVVVELNDGSGTVVYDSGKVANSVPYPVVLANDTLVGNIAAGNKDLPLRWYARAWDSDDVAGAYSDALPFRIGDVPTITVTSPVLDGDIVNNPSPTVTWSFSAAGGRIQSARRLVYAQGTTVVHDTGWVSDTGTTYTPPTAIVSNGLSYSVTVYVRDSGGLENSATRTFTVTFTQPTAPTYTLDPSGYMVNGYLSITWNNSTQDTEFNSWRVYRRKQGTSDWVLAAEYTDQLASYTYQDWMLPSNVTYEYTVVQTAIRFGVVVESVYNTTTVATQSEDYWLIHPTDNSLNVRLNIVTSDSYTEEYESQTLNIIGRGRKTDYGTRWGYSGSLTAQIRNSAWTGLTARQQKQALEALKAQKVQVYLRNPFGDIWMVTMGDVQVSRIAGVGPNEFCDVTVPYVEVAG